MVLAPIFRREYMNIIFMFDKYVGYVFPHYTTYPEHWTVFEEAQHEGSQD